MLMHLRQGISMIGCAILKSSIERTFLMDRESFLMLIQMAVLTRETWITMNGRSFASIS